MDDPATHFIDRRAGGAPRPGADPRRGARRRRGGRRCRPYSVLPGGLPGRCPAPRGRRPGSLPARARRPPAVAGMTATSHRSRDRSSAQDRPHSSCPCARAPRLGSLALGPGRARALAGAGHARRLVRRPAEVRWRTGDLTGRRRGGGGRAAGRRGGSGRPAGRAEAAASVGARANRAGSRRRDRMAAGSIDAIFAGSRSAAWPPDADEPPPTAPTLFDRGLRAAAGEPSEAPAARRAATRGPGGAGRRPGAAPGPMTLGLWADDPTERAGRARTCRACAELEAGRTALVAGKFNEAVLHFGLALRLAPALAPAVLEATAGAARPTCSSSAATHIGWPATRTRRGRRTLPRRAAGCPSA